MSKEVIKLEGGEEERRKGGKIHAIAQHVGNDCTLTSLYVVQVHPTHARKGIREKRFEIGNLHCL